MSIVKFAEKYFLRLYQAHHKSRLTKDDKIKTTLVVLSCFTLIIPGFFALIYGLSGLFGRGKPLKEAPKPVQEEAKKVEETVQKAIPHPFLELIPHIQFEGYSGQFYRKELLSFLEKENEEEQKNLFKSASTFTNLKSPMLFLDLLQTMRYTRNPELCAAVSQAFSPLFRDLPEAMLRGSVVEILTSAINPKQVFLTAKAFQKLFKLPGEANALQKVLHKLFQCNITEEVAHLIEEQFAEPPTEEMAWHILEGLCPRITNIQSAAREKCNFDFLMQSPEVLNLGLDPLNRNLYCRLVARSLFGLRKHDLPPYVVHLVQQLRDYPSAQTLMHYLDFYFCPATAEEFHAAFDQLRPYPPEHLHFVDQTIRDYLTPTFISKRGKAASAALKVHEEELRDLVKAAQEIFYDTPKGFALLAKTPMPKRMQVVNLFREDVLGNGLLADFPEKPTAYPVIKKLIKMDHEEAKIALQSIAQKLEKPIEGKALAQAITMQARAYDTH